MRDEFFQLTAQCIRTQDVVTFERWADAFARTLRPGDVVALRGDLGAGKTTFVAAAVRALHGQDVASSPTFTFRQTYPGTPRIEHIDLYRLDDPREATELGLEDAFDRDSVVFVEWPERLPRLIPSGALRITIAGSGMAARDIVIERDA